LSSSSARRDKSKLPVASRTNDIPVRKSLGASKRKEDSPLQAVSQSASSVRERSAVVDERETENPPGAEQLARTDLSQTDPSLELKIAKRGSSKRLSLSQKAWAVVNKPPVRAARLQDSPKDKDMAVHDSLGGSGGPEGFRVDYRGRSGLADADGDDGKETELVALRVVLQRNAQLLSDANSELSPSRFSKKPSAILESRLKAAVQHTAEWIRRLDPQGGLNLDQDWEIGLRDRISASVGSRLFVEPKHVTPDHN
jgi:hypothetical protein